MEGAEHPLVPVRDICSHFPFSRTIPVYTGEKPDTPLDIYVYTGADGSFSLYEDEGTNYNYEKGQYSLIPFTWSDSDKSLTIGDRRGQFTGMVKDRIFRIIVVSKEQPVAFLSKDTGAKEIQYNGHEITIKL